jgi:hypothetical protein
VASGFGGRRAGGSDGAESRGVSGLHRGTYGRQTCGATGAPITGP